MKVTIEIKVENEAGAFGAAELVQQKLEAIPIQHYCETAYISVMGPDGLTFAPDTGVRVNIKD